MITKENLEILYNAIYIDPLRKPPCVEVNIKNNEIIDMSNYSNDYSVNISAIYNPKDHVVSVEYKIYDAYPFIESTILDITQEENDLIASEIERICMQREKCTCAEFIRRHEYNYRSIYARQIADFYNDIARVLTDYENPQNVDYNVNEEMYRLLVKIQNCMEVE